MSLPVLATKLHIPAAKPKLVVRTRLIERLNEGRHRKLTLISAPAGFGKTTLVSEWVANCERPVAWLSLDEADSDPTRFLTYFVAALQTIAPNIGEGALRTLRSGQPPPTETIMTGLLNELAAIQDDFCLVLDDYHIVESRTIDSALTFLLQYLPPQMHLVITTREDPNLPLNRMRARGQLTELRITDMRFTLDETARFLNQVMNLTLTPKDIEALEARTEGWIAGLQLAGISMQGQQDTTSFIQSFTGSHRFVMDYLVEEVLKQQSEAIQTFLLRTSILDRMCAELCDALLVDSPVSGQETLEYLEGANLFLIPLDNERQWYRYHHLFSDLLRQRLLKLADTTPTSSTGEKMGLLPELHCRASWWFEENDLEVEAFQHAAEANDIDRAERLIGGKGMPLHYRGAMTPVLEWLETLPAEVLDPRPSLLVTYASALTMIGKPVDLIEEKLQTAAAALQDAERNETTRDLFGQIAAIRAMLAIPTNKVDILIAQSRLALENLHPDNLPVRTNASWTLGYAYQLQGDREAAIQAYTEAIPVSMASGNTMMTIAAETCLGQVQEAENQFDLATQAYKRVLHLAGDPPFPGACESHLGLARIAYQRNDLDAAEQHAQKSLELAQQLENIDTPAASRIMLGRLKLAQGDMEGTSTLLSEAEAFIDQHHSAHRMPEVADARVKLLLHQGNLSAAEDLTHMYNIPLALARVHLSRGETTKALDVLEPLRREADTRGWKDLQLQVLILQAVAQHVHGNQEQALHTLDEALMLAEPGGYVRIFVDEGQPMAALLQEFANRGTSPEYVRQILKAFGKANGKTAITQPLIEPLTDRELEVLRMLGTYLTGPEIASQLSVSLNTMRTHTKNIYNKLGVNTRQEAVRRAQELGLL